MLSVRSVTMVPILATAQAYFPESANRTVLIAHAWRPSGDETRPAANGPDGWTHVGEPATPAVVEHLHKEGYTWVNLQAGGVAKPFHDVAISSLI